jgi:molybdate transport system substrate-binding protein
MRAKSIQLYLRHVLFVLLSLFFMTANGNSTVSKSEPLIIFAAASFKNALDEIAKIWQAERPEGNAPLAISYAGSGKLARQIEQGAPADIFISANQTWVDYLIQQEWVDGSSKQILVENNLVLIASKNFQRKLQFNAHLDIKKYLDNDYFTMAHVTSVPAGIYGKSALQYFDLWGDVEEQLVQTDNVRASLQLVARGEAAFGIVYKSDVTTSSNVHIISMIPEYSHEKIKYPVVKVEKIKNQIRDDFYNFLFTMRAKEIFVKHGFGVKE